MLECFYYYYDNYLMKNITKYVVIGLAFAPFMVSAALTASSGLNTIDDLWGKVLLVMNWIISIFFVVATIFIIMAGFKYVTAGGDSSKIDEAKHMLTYAIIGIAVGLLAFTIPKLIGGFVGVTPVDINAIPR